jgi:tRNA(fMet)-specific endonuclease VapC
VSFFDTSFVVDLLREQRRNLQGPAHRKLESIGDAPVRLSVFVVCELEAGAALSRNPEEVKKVRLLCQHYEVVYPDDRFAPIYGTTLAEIRKQGYSVATMDLLVATAALVDNDTLITRNLKDFQKISGLRVEGY